MRKSALLLCMALGAARLHADPMALSVGDAVDLALGASLEAYGLELAALEARRSLDNRWNLFLPALSAGASAKLGDRLLTDTPLGSSTDGLDTTLTLGTRLSLANGLPFDLEERRAAATAAELAAADARARVARDAQKAYFLLASLEQDLANKARATGLAEERSGLAALRFDRGLGSELDSLRAQLSERNARAAYEKALADYEKRKAAFRRRLGLEAGVQLTLSTPLTAPALSDDAEGAGDAPIEGRYDVRKAGLAMKAAATATARYVAVYRLPLVTLDASWNFSLTDPASARDAYSVGAGLAFNADAWIPNSRRDLELRVLRETETRLAMTYAQAKRDARDEIAALRIDIGSARSAIALAEGQESLAVRILARAREAYERGSATVLELEDARLAADSATQSLIASRYQYLSLIIDLGYALGVDWRELVR
ncbi:MAG: hypothetical protein CVV47_12205 [Spirochaetae bacterium HGW-Spirochaetae-3]|jgi:outer membrane protein TolC|nr:MAG: hypothetical protein CVV47_12205 [Spirochaetae bacterium HGW-Spirochaetae-3]